MGQGNSQFHIRSQMHGKVLDVENGVAECGTRIILFPEKPDNSPNQLWILEPCGDGYFYVVTALDDNLVMDVAGGDEMGCKIALWEKKVPAEPNQMFQQRGDLLISAVNPELVVDIEGANPDDGAGIILWEPLGGPNQAWTIGPLGGGEGVNVYLECQMNGKVLDVKGRAAEKGTEVILWPKDDPQAQNQLWRMEPTGDGWNNIVSCLDDNLTLDVCGGQGNEGDLLIIWERARDSPVPNQKFQLRGNALVSEVNPDLVVDVKGGEGEDGANLILWTPGEFAKPNQQFDTVRA